MSRVIAIAACGLTLAACSATVSSLSLLKPAPSSEALRIESEPPGAEAKTSLGQSCRTPCELGAQAAGEFSVTLTLAGFQPQTVMVRPEAPPVTRDSEVAPSGPRLAPNPVYVELQPAPAASPAKPVAPKKKKPIAAAPRTTPAPVAAAMPAPPPSPAPAPSMEPAASATNYPWPSR